MAEKKRVGILTLYYMNYNYGALLQAYALQMAIQRMGYDCELISYDWRSNLYKNVLLAQDKTKNEEFIKFEKEIPHSEIVYSQEMVSLMNEHYDIFVCGSDQVWNDQLLYINEFAPQSFYLQFASEKKVKIFYAASIGKMSLLSQTENILKEGLKTADKISVREKSAMKYLQSLCPDIVCEQVLDPTMLLSVNEWRDIIKKNNSQEPYILVYFLMKEEKMCIVREYVEKIAKKNGYRIVYLPCENIGPREFLGLVDGAEFILTNSFHGTIFSILFHKKFKVFGHQDDSNPQNTNARMYELCELFGMSNCIGNISELENLQLKFDCDYNVVDEILNKKKAEALSFLSEALAIEKKDFIITERRKCYGCGYCMSICDQNAISFVVDEEGFEYPVIDMDKCNKCGKCQEVCCANKEVDNWPDTMFLSENFSGMLNRDADVILEELMKHFGAKEGENIYVGNGCEILKEKYHQNTICIEKPCGGQMSSMIEDMLNKNLISDDIYNNIYKGGNAFRLCCYRCLQKKEFKGDIYLSPGKDGRAIIAPVSEKGETFWYKFLSVYENVIKEYGLNIKECEFSESMLGVQETLKGIGRVFFFSEMKNENFEGAYLNDMSRMKKREEKNKQYDNAVLFENYRRECFRLIKQIESTVDLTEHIKTKNYQFVIYGAGKVGRKLNELFGEKVLCFIDQGKVFSESQHEVDDKQVFQLGNPKLAEVFKDVKEIIVLVTPGWDFEKIVKNCQTSFLNNHMIEFSKIRFKSVVDFLKEFYNE